MNGFCYMLLGIEIGRHINKERIRRLEEAVDEIKAKKQTRRKDIIVEVREEYEKRDDKQREERMRKVVEAVKEALNDAKNLFPES